MEERKDCGILLKMINDEMEKNANNILRTQDMTFSQMGALVALNAAPEGQLPLKELEKQLHVAQSTIAGIISRLERKALVEPLGDPQDRRIKLARITEAGRERVRDSEQHRVQAEEHLLSGLTETERDIFYALLKKVYDTF